MIRKGFQKNKTECAEKIPYQVLNKKKKDKNKETGR